MLSLQLLLLQSSLSDDEEMSKWALEIILKARIKDSKSKAKNVRKFVLPTDEEYNWTAENLMDFLKWELPSVQRKIFYPPLLRQFSIEELKTRKEHIVEQLKGILCHNQTNERVVQQVFTFRFIEI